MTILSVKAWDYLLILNMPMLSLIADKYLLYSLLCLVSLFIVNLVKSLSSPLVPMNQRLLPFILRPKWNSISVVFYHFLALSLLKLSVAWRIYNPLLISYRLIESITESKILEFQSVTYTNSFISIKPFWIISQHTYNLLTWVQSLSLILFLNVISLTSVVYVSTP